MKKQTIGSALFLMLVMVLVVYVMYLQCRLDPIDRPDEPKVISETFKIKPEDFVIADGGGADLYKGNLTLWQSVEGINGAASYAYSEGFEYGVLTLELRVRRDDPNSAGGLEMVNANWFWAMGFESRENETPFEVVSDTLDFTNTGSINFAYKGEAGCNVDVIGGKLKLFKTVTNFGE